MAFQKVLAQGDKGSLILSEEAGELKLALAGDISLGGGSSKGFIKAKAAIELDVEGKEIIDAGFDLAAHKFAGNAAIVAAIDGAKALVDAELAKI